MAVFTRMSFCSRKLSEAVLDVASFHVKLRVHIIDAIYEFSVII